MQSLPQSMLLPHAFDLTPQPSGPQATAGHTHALLVQTRPSTQDAVVQSRVAPQALLITPHLPSHAAAATAGHTQLLPLQV